MQINTLKSMTAGRGSQYEEMLANNAIDRVAPDDHAYEMLGGLVEHKGVRPLPEIVDMAAGAANGSPIGANHVQAAISHKYPSEAFQILHSAMKMVPGRAA